MSLCQNYIMYCIQIFPLAICIVPDVCFAIDIHIHFKKSDIIIIILFLFTEPTFALHAFEPVVNLWTFLLESCLKNI